MRYKYAPTEHAWQGFQLGYKALEQNRDGLQDALKKYGKHLDGCDIRPRHANDQRLFSEMVCDCGLSAVIAKVGENQ